MKTISELTTEFPRTGRVDWIGIAQVRGGTIELQNSVTLQAGTGIEGEHHAKSGKSKRQVTLIQGEHLPVIASLLGRNDVDPAVLRRNIVVSGINLLALKDQQFRLGEALLEGSGLCAPCSQMEANLGPGGYNAMRGHGGITAIVLEGGAVRVGDTVVAVVEAPAPT